MRRNLLFIFAFVFVAMGFSNGTRSGPERYLPKAHTPLNNVFSEQRLVRSGDVIFRRGYGLISDVLMSFGQREKKYSHAGIIAIENQRIFVYHSMGGEENPSNKIRKDPPEVFCNQANAKTFGIFRSDLGAEEISLILSEVQQAYSSGLEFDTKFDLSSFDKMYCTEFLYRLFTETAGDNYLPLSAVSGVRYVSCDDIYLSGHFKPVYQYHY